MSTRAAIPAALLAAALLAGCAYVQHVPPGQSLSEAMAKKAQLVMLPAPPPQPASAIAAKNAAAQSPVLQQEKVADAFTLGNLCLQQGRYKDAIAAYESALKEDPSFAEAWNNLAIAYQDSGEADKAMEAFRKYKMVALH